MTTSDCPDDDPVLTQRSGVEPRPACGADNDTSSLSEVSRKGCMFFGHLNARSLSQCVDELRDWASVASDKGGKVFLSCSETWLNEGIPDGFVSIHGLTLLRKDRGAHGGGVTVHCSGDVNCVRRNDLETGWKHFGWS